LYSINQINNPSKMNFSFKLLSLTLFASSVEALIPDGAGMNSVMSFDRHPSMGYGYGGSDMSLQNDFYGVPSYGQQQGGFGGGGGGGGYGEQQGDFGMPSFHQQQQGMRGGGGMGGGMGDFSPRGDFGRGGMAMGARRGILPDENFGLNAEVGSANRRPGSMTSQHFGGRPSFHHAMGGGGDFGGDMGFDMPPMNGQMGGEGMRGGFGGREEFRQMGRNGMGMGGEDEFRGMGRNNGMGMGGGRMGEMNGQGMGGGFGGREEFRSSGSSARQAGSW
jgi:hypothetical protein